MLYVAGIDHGGGTKVRRVVGNNNVDYNFGTRNVLLTIADAHNP